jgi:cytochrome c553
MNPRISIINTLMFRLPFYVMLTLAVSLPVHGDHHESTEPDLEEAALLYEDRCSICHEEDGNSDVEKLNLVDRLWKHGGSLEQIEKTITEGVPGTKMKPQRDKLTAEQIHGLAIFVKHLEKTMHGKSAGDSGGPDASGIGDDVTRDAPDLDALPDLNSLHLLPGTFELSGPEAAQEVIVMGVFADGLERDLTSACRFSISNPDLAEVHSSGRVFAKSDGTAILRAEIAGQAIEKSIGIRGTQQPRPFSFERQVGGVLTRNGCNAYDCHGGIKGRAGFKLSFNGLRPDDDYEWIVQGGGFQVLTDEILGERIPRVNTADPGKSLILVKPTLQLDHEGGKRLYKGSPHYRKLLDWIRAGAPGSDEGAGQFKIRDLIVYPAESVLLPDQTQKLVVMAELADGSIEDITDQVHFRSNNKDIAKMVAPGIVQARIAGEADIIIRAVGRSSSARIGVIKQPVPDIALPPASNYIDEHVFKKLQKFHLVPSQLSSDGEFLRRICLDLTGRLPPTIRVREFLEDPDPAKREKLINILLESPEYNDFWTFRFADLFRIALYTGNAYPDFTKWYYEWIRENIETNKPWDQVARERLAAQGLFGPSRHYFIDRPAQDVMAEQVRVFMGRRFDCAQCHDHPFEIWSQDQFWGLSAFFGRIVEIGKYGAGLFADLPGGHGDRGKGGDIIHPRNKKVVVPTYLAGDSLPGEKHEDPRRYFAGWVTEHPFFAEAIVNRMWSYFFGRGIVDPIDDFGTSNPPSHKELLEDLSRDFVEHGHDLKHIIRRIVSSRTYQLSGRANETNRHDQVNYSHAVNRPLDAEVLLDAIVDVTQVPEVFNRLRGGIAPEGTRAVQLRETDAYPSIFMDAWGRPDRLMIPDRDGQPNIQQAMHAYAGRTFTEKLEKAAGRIGKLIEKNASNRQVIDEFCLAAFTRYPTEPEVAALGKMIDQKVSRREAIEDLVWGLINTREFSYNH